MRTWDFIPDLRRQHWEVSAGEGLDLIYIYIFNFNYWMLLLYFILSYCILLEREGVGGERERILSRFHAQCWTPCGLSSITDQRSWPELKSRVRHLTNWATQARPFLVLFIYFLFPFNISLEVYFFLERVRVGASGQRERETENPKQVCAVTVEPDAGLDLTKLWDHDLSRN